MAPNQGREVRLSFSSRLGATPAQAWSWALSVDGVSRELWPLMRMTAAPGVRNLDDVAIEPGKRLFRSWIFLLGIIPLGYSDLTLVELERGRRFLEDSPMSSMRRWRHERTIVPAPGGCTLRDDLTFEPRIAPALTAWLIRTIFTHRHAVLRQELGG